MCWFYYIGSFFIVVNGWACQPFVPSTAATTTLLDSTTIVLIAASFFPFPNPWRLLDHLDEAPPEQYKDFYRLAYLLLRTSTGKWQCSPTLDLPLGCFGRDGVMDDSFASISIHNQTIHTALMGSSAYRWTEDSLYQFDRTTYKWLLVEATTSDYHRSDPDQFDELGNPLSQIPESERWLFPLNSATPN